MKKKILLTFIAVEVLIFIAMLLVDFGVLNANIDPRSLKSIIIHVTTIVAIFVCIDGYRRVDD